MELKKKRLTGSRLQAGKLLKKAFGRLLFQTNARSKSQGGRRVASSLIKEACEVVAFSDRLRQPDNLSERRVLLSLETHGFASPPRDRFAFIVCNRRLAKDHCHPPARKSLGQQTFVLNDIYPCL